MNNERKHAGGALKVRVARTMEDMMQIAAIRGATYLVEQECPYAEEFDGNDLCGLHLIGSRDGEPAGCLRIRFFADFAKLERLAVRREHRRSTLAFRVVDFGIKLCRQKGYGRIYGHAQDRLVPFWSRFGARPIHRNKPKLMFSDFGYTEMLLETSPLPNAVTLASDPYEIIRPEGEWDREGVLEQSTERGVTSPLMAAA